MIDPATKYAGNVDPAHRLAMDTLAMTRQLLMPHRGHFESFLEAERRAHSVGHILDPTLYRDMINSKSFEQQVRLVRAAVAFLDATDAVATELEKTDDK